MHGQRFKPLITLSRTEKVRLTANFSPPGELNPTSGLPDQRLSQLHHIATDNNIRADTGDDIAKTM